jgi:hypothetical protein
LLAAFAANGGCDAEGDDEEDESEEAPRADCSTEMRDDTYALGLEKSGASVRLAFRDALPAPPDRGDNTWTIALLDADGTPVEGAQIGVEPFMPDHMHGTSIEAQVMPGEAPGEYVIDRLNLFMPGLWDVTLNVALADGATDQVVFSFCVDP